MVHHFDRSGARSAAAVLLCLYLLQVINNCTHHQKAVYGFVWCSAYSMFASCGLERDVILWQVRPLSYICVLDEHRTKLDCRVPCLELVVDNNMQ